MPSFRIICTIGVAAVVFLCSRAPAVAHESQDKQNSTRVELRFEKPHAIASDAEFNRRFDHRDKREPLQLNAETFQVLFPSNYVDDGSFGLLVFISPTNSGFMCPPEWHEVLAEKKLVYIGADGVGNEKPVDRRVRLAVEAALHMQERHRLDRSRIFVGGFSGGGKIAAMCGMTYPDVFGGALSICGPTFYRNIPTGKRENEMYLRTFKAPPARWLNIARLQSRHVLLSGDRDFNVDPTRQIFELGYRKDGFRHATLIIVPEMEHALPGGKWFASAIDALNPASAAATTVASTQSTTAPAK